MFRTYPLILQENHYYAYGSAIPKLSTANGRERYTYNGKELIEDFNINLHDYGARQYDPLTARWNGVDALAEKYHSTTGYGYVGGNPISRIDPDGMRTWYFSEDDTYLGMTNDTHADAVCIVPAYNAMDVATYSNSKDIINLLGGDDNAASYLRDLGISYNVAGLLKFDNDYRGKVDKNKPVTLNNIPIDYILRDGKRVDLFAEWGVALKLVKPSNANTKRMDVFDHGLGAVLDINPAIKPYSSNGFNFVEPTSGDANGHLHPLPSNNYKFYLKDYLPMNLRNPSCPSDQDYTYSRNTSYYNFISEPDYFIFYRKETTLMNGHGRMVTLPQNTIKVPKSLLK